MKEMAIHYNAGLVLTLAAVCLVRQSCGDVGNGPELQEVLCRYMTSSVELVKTDH